MSKIWLIVLAFATYSPSICAFSKQDQMPADFVSLAEIAPDIKIEMKYAGSDNFIGRPIAGYEAEKCLLTRPTALALQKSQQWLTQFKLQLVVYDCYRPQKAVTEFVQWSKDLNDTKKMESHYPKVAKANLFSEGYIATKSGHSRGSTVDIGLTGLDAGAPFDYFDPVSHTRAEQISTAARATRALLCATLERFGFVNYDKEWWHFTLKNEPHPNQYFDFPIR